MHLQFKMAVAEHVLFRRESLGTLLFSVGDNNVNAWRVLRFRRSEASFKEPNSNNFVIVDVITRTYNKTKGFKLSDFPETLCEYCFIGGHAVSLYQQCHISSGNE
jgi:hypothetical protein